MKTRFTMIEFLVVKSCHIHHSSPACARQSKAGFLGEKAARKSASLSVPTIHQTLHQPIIAAQPIPAPGSTREGFGGEKAARKSASLPVPTIHQTLHRPIIAARQSLRSASGEVEQKREEIFPQKSGKI
ncbi:hypothetical protein, partial [uncultured Victivallis sp.]|uniref:hypothetical protein n=1 Tax=uncultured Victivallis sp. TaxID=354118 RepID=UPI0025FF12FA